MKALTSVCLLYSGTKAQMAKQQALFVFSSWQADSFSLLQPGIGDIYFPDIHTAALLAVSALKCYAIALYPRS